MRVLIWQQFSSNHSACYTVVGEFQSVEAAHSAAETILRIVKQAGDWTITDGDYGEEPTPIEQEYGRQYGFDWKQRIDWSTFFRRDETIQQLDRLVIVDTRPIQTWQTGHQFANLFTAMGAFVARHVFEGKEPGEATIAEVMEIAIELRAKSASPDLAAAICDELNIFAKQKSPTHYTSYGIPWLNYHPSLAQFSPDEIRRLEAQYLVDTELRQELHQQYPEHGKEFTDHWAQSRVLSHDQYWLVQNCRTDLNVSRLKVERIDQSVHLQLVHFNNILMGLLVIMKYLHARGCTDLEYAVHQYEG